MVSRTVLLMITPYSQPRLEGISRFARAHGWNLMMEDRLLPDEDPRQYDGVLMTLRDAPEAVAAARRLTPPGSVAARASSDTLAHPHPLIRAALVHIRQNLARSFGTSEIAAALGISRSHFDHLFVHETGHSVGKEILSQRLREARRLLSDTDLPIAAIARLTGFCNAGYLSNTFRRAMSISPKAWRRRSAQL